LSLQVLKWPGTSADLIDVNQITFEELAFTLDLMRAAVGLKSGDFAEAEKLEETVRAAMQSDRRDPD
jgi:hypothetical protein